jgi:hypothetical protein
MFDDQRRARRDLHFPGPAPVSGRAVPAMSAMQRVATHEFKNDYFYIVLRQTPEHGPQTY